MKALPATRNLLYAWVIPFILIAGCQGDRHCRSSRLSLLPYPQEVLPLHGRYGFPDTVRVSVSGMDELSDPVLFRQLEEITGTLHAISIPVGMTDDPDIWIGLPGSDTAFRGFCESEGILPDEGLGEEGYVLKITGNRILLAGNSRHGVFYGVQTLRQLSREFSEQTALPSMLITDWPEIPVRAIMDDISRGPVPTKEYIKEQIRRYSELKINSMSFYIEHVVRTEKYPGFAPEDGALTIEEFRELSDYAADYHISLIGNFQSLGHAEKVLAAPGFRHLGATSRMYDPLNPEAVKFLRDIYREMAPAFSSCWFTPNCDEAWDLSRAVLSGKAAELGVARVYSDHVRRIDTTLRELGKRTLIWGDIILEFPEILALLPSHVLIGAWNYDALGSYAGFIDPIKDAGFEFTVSPGILNSTRLIPDYRQTLTNIKNFISEGHEKGTRGVYCTVWDDGGPHFFTLDWYGVAYAAERCWKPDTEDAGPFDGRFSEAFYGDRGNAVPRALHELNKLTGLNPTYEMNEGIFGKILVPEPGKSLSFNLSEWNEVHEIVTRAEQLLSKGIPTRYEGDIPYLQFVCRQYRFMAESRNILLEASSLYRSALDEVTGDRAKALERLGSARELIAGLAGSFQALYSEFKVLWETENRPYWLTESTRLYERRIEAFESQLQMLDQAMDGCRQGALLPSVEKIRLDIREHSGQVFQYWLICGPFPLSGSKDTVDFLTAIGGETGARPYPGMEFLDRNGRRAAWHKYDSPYRHVVEMGDACPVQEPSVAYAYCTLDSPGDIQAKGVLQHSEALSLYCNGQMVYENQGRQESGRAETAFMLPLQKGRNHILLKLAGPGTGGDFAFRLDGAETRNHKQKYLIIN